MKAANFIYYEKANKPKNDEFYYYSFEFYKPIFINYSIIKCEKKALKK